MQENVLEIDFSNTDGSKELIDVVVEKLENAGRGNLSVILKLKDLKINQSQMIFIKSLVESYKNKLVYVESEDETVRDICVELDINTTKLDLDVLDDIFEQKEKEDENLVEDTQKQVIGVYRKAGEKEEALVDLNENVDFYATKTDEPVVVDSKETMYVNQTLRNGQVIDFDGNVVIIGDSHPGSEIKATGDITVWGVLGSIAHAGIKGNKDARIRALKMNAVQLRIADCYSRRPDGGNIPYVNKSSEFTPEEARIVDDSIVLFKMIHD